MITTHHRSLRGNTATCCMHAANRTSRREIFTRNEVIKRVREEDLRAIQLERQKNQFRPNKSFVRVANVRQFKGGYKIVGIAPLLPLTNMELKRGLKHLGFTGIRRGELVTTL